MPDLEQSRTEMCMYNTFIGVDPGVRGGIAIIGADVEPEAFSTANMTEHQIWRWFRDVSGGYSNVFACIELVGGWVGSHGRKEGDDGTQSNPGSAMFVFGKSYGALHMAIIAAGIPFEAVRPQAWQRKLGLRTKGEGETTTKWKGFLKSEAARMFPQVKVTKGVADALLLAHYCKLKWGMSC